VAGVGFRLSALALGDGRFELTSLPNSLLSLIFLLLPVDDRLRCREVCRAWRDFLSDYSLWTLCDLGPRSGVAARARGSLLAAASARAAGRLASVDVSACDQLEEGDLPAVAAANGGSLLELRAWGCAPNANAGPGWRYFETARIQEILAAAPQLRALQADVAFRPAEAAAMLGGGALAIQRGYINGYDVENGGDIRYDVVAAAEAAAAHATLTGLRLRRAHLEEAGALEAVVTLAIGQLRSLELTECSLSPASLPALARLLAVGSLSELVIEGDGREGVLEGPGVVPFAAALRVARLDRLGLRWLRLWHSPEAGRAVLAACANHDSLRELDLKGNAAPSHAAARMCADALAALLVPGAPLECLGLEACYMRDGLRGLVESLPASRLRKLDISWNDLPSAFAADVAEAARASETLRELSAYQADELPALAEAMRLVRSRARRAAEAREQ